MATAGAMIALAITFLFLKCFFRCAGYEMQAKTQKARVQDKYQKNHYREYEGELFWVDDNITDIF